MTDFCFKNISTAAAEGAQVWRQATERGGARAGYSMEAESRGGPEGREHHTQDLLAIFPISGLSKCRNGDCLLLGAPGRA